MAKIVVTGAAGFIGYHLSKSLAEDGHTVIGFDNFNDFYYDAQLKYARKELLDQIPGVIVREIDLKKIYILWRLAVLLNFFFFHLTCISFFLCKSFT